MAGALLGTLLDGVHVATATTRYTHPAFLGVAWWAPLLFAGGALAIGYAHTIVDLVVDRQVRPDAGRVAIGLVVLVALWTTSGLVKPAHTALWILAPASLAMWWSLDGSAVGLVLAFATASCGVAVEATLVSAGAFVYTAPDAGRVASWLPWLYVAASVAVGNLARWLAADRARGAGGPGATRTPGRSLARYSSAVERQPYGALIGLQRAGWPPGISTK